MIFLFLLWLLDISFVYLIWLFCLCEDLFRLFSFMKLLLIVFVVVVLIVLHRMCLFDAIELRLNKVKCKGKIYTSHSFFWSVHFS